MNPQRKSIIQPAIQAFQAGNFDEANSFLKRLLQSNIYYADTIFELGCSYVEANKFVEATNVFICLQFFQKNDERIPYNLGLIYSLQGKHQLALEEYDLCLKIQPNDVEVLINKGATLIDTKDYVLALGVLEKAIQIESNIPEAWSNKGIALNHLNLYQDSINAYREAIKLNQQYYEAWSNLSVPLNSLKRFLEASEACDKALEFKPDYPEGLSNKGLTLVELNRIDEAILHFNKALSLKPDYAEGWSNKGLALLRLKRIDEAIAHFDNALRLSPDNAKVWSNKALALNELKRHEEAIFHYERSLSLKVDIDWIYGDLLHTKMKICSWLDLSCYLKNIPIKILSDEKIILPFVLFALVDDLNLHKKSAEIFAKTQFPLNIALGSIPKSTDNKKIRVGYFSADFKIHAVSILAVELFETHDKNNFEIIAFSLGLDDKSPIRLRLTKAFNQFIDVSGMSDLDVAKLSRELHVDIAVDLGGYTAGNRTGIFSYRAAPIQVSYLGYLGTMGAEYIDYLIADKIIIPEKSKNYYSEKIVYLPSYQVNDRKRKISDKVFTRKELCLPEKGFVFCCFCGNYKILPVIFDGWMRILKVVEGSVLFLYADNKRVEENIKKEAEARGVNSARLLFGKNIPPDENLSRYRSCDLFLDTNPYNAGTTASDALWAGLPVLTLKGVSFASRVAASLLNSIGLPELITNTQEEYEALAIELAMNPKKFGDIKYKLENNRLTAPLFDSSLFTQNLERAFKQMVARYNFDLPPDHISIE
jgi:predicted O-linked N-acetylglucosamine transferase (SPINDLY family)